MPLSPFGARRKVVMNNVNMSTRVSGPTVSSVPSVSAGVGSSRLSPSEKNPPVSGSKATTVNPLAPQQADLDKAVKQIQSYLRESGRNLAVSFDESVDRYVARVVEASSGEVIRTIPAEEMLEVSRMIQEHLGWLVNQKA
jgi:flagellar protein FlaG